MSTSLSTKHAKLLALMADIRGDLEAICSPAAPIFATLMTKQEVLAQTYLHDLHDVQTSPTRTEHPLESEFRSLWKKAYPAYVLTGNDRKQIHYLFSSTIKSGYPQMNAVFLERIINNFRTSTAEWVATNQYIGTFVKHFQRFVSGPVGRGDLQNQRSLHQRIGL